MKYRFTIMDAALAEFRRCTKREQMLMEDWFQRIAEFPDSMADFETHDAHGRLLQVALRGEWLVTYYIDAPVWLVHILEIERAD